MFKLDLDSLKQAATCTRLMANSANAANRLTPEAEPVSQLANLAMLAISHGSRSAANDAWSTVAVAELIDAAMLACEHYKDGPQARQDMRQQCLEVPLDQRAGLRDYFLGKYGVAGDRGE